MARFKRLEDGTAVLEEGVGVNSISPVVEEVELDGLTDKVLEEIRHNANDFTIDRDEHDQVRGLKRGKRKIKLRNV